eukprot:Skav208952  [mRNA]  locus=scaffold1580:136359:137930:- [translate_table: standard]
MRARRSHESSGEGTLSLRLQDMKLLRGTNLVEVLSGFGHQLRANSLNQSLTPEQAADLYRKSSQVERLDYFISHCWQDERFAKVIALYIHQNLMMAMIVSSIVAICLATLTWLKVLPVKAANDGISVDHFPWALCGGMMTFFYVLFTWHHISFFVRPSIYFLDKFCVHQGDDDLKAQGVQAFASFVARSDCMLLLWTTQYFTRLWCTLELAALVKSTHMKAQEVPLKILPLQLAKASFVMWVTVFLVYAINQFNRVLERPLPELYITIGALLVASFFFIQALRQYAHDRKDLHHQMEIFSVQEAKCSDERDRRWVERSMLRWFADLELCNLHIRQAVREQVEKSVGPERHIAMRFLLPVLLVNLFNEADYIAGGYHTGYRITMASVGFAAFVLALPPFSYRLAFCFAQHRRWYVDLLINTGLSLVVVFVAAGAFVLTYFVVANPDVSDLVLCIPVLEVAAVLWLQRRSFAALTFSP